jgi:hypothetical protein
MMRVLLGLVKGLAAGAAVAYLLVQLGVAGSGMVSYLACAAVGALVGVICGRAPWRAETIWTPIVKAIVGGLIGAGLCFVGRRFLPEVHFNLAAPVGPIGTHDGSFLAIAVGVLYGIFVEVDDGGADKPRSDPPRLPVARP